MGRWGYTVVDKKPFELDCSLTYMMPMVPIDKPSYSEFEELTECKATPVKYGYIFESIDGKHQQKLFVAEYVKFLMYTGYIKNRADTQPC